MNIIILAGGSGTRLWPLSRDRYPKQFIKLQGKKESLFQETFQRSLLLASLEDIYVVTNERYKFLLIREIKELGHIYNENNILVEPEAKNTLPAIYAGVHEISKRGQDSVVVFPSDHIIAKSLDFAEIIKESEKLIKNHIVTFGIIPDSPNTGYGYISPGIQQENGYIVEAFKEKPTHEKALEYIQQGYYWNSGIFMFNSTVFVNEVKKHSQEIYEAFESSNILETAFSKIKTKISIDYGLMEKSERVAVVPVDIGWNDLGSFDSFYTVFEKDNNGNITIDDTVSIDSNNNIISSYNGKLVATVGVNDLIVIDNRDALLICKKEESQKIKNIVDVLKERHDLRTEYHVQDYRPWGHYEVLEEQKSAFKIKKITVNVGESVSYQLHYHRNEHWIVVKGMAQVIIDDKEIFVRAGESVYIKEGQKHQLKNPGKMPLEIIEVQMGDYLEDAIVQEF